MELHALPFGQAAWDKRKEIMRGIIAARPGPPYDFRDALWLVANERSVLTLRALFLEALAEATGSRGCIPPAIRPLNRFIESRAAARSARPVLDGTARSLVVEELARDIAGRRKGMGAPESLAPSIAPLVADALDKIYVYGLSDEMLKKAAQDCLPAMLLADIKHAYEKWLGAHGLADPAAARAAFAPATEDFAEFRTVVLDGFYDADPAELRVMVALSGAPEFKFLLEAPGLCMPDMRAAGMPYFGTDALLSALGFTLPEAAPSRRDVEADALSGALFGGRLLSRSKADAKRLGALTGDVTIAGAINPAEETQYAAHAIKRGALDGSIPDLNRVAVWLADPGAYMPLVERAFGEAGIPFHSGGRLLIESPAAAAFMRLLAVPRDGYSFASVRAALCSPLLKLGPDGNHPEAFARFGRAERITRGRREWLERLKIPRIAVEDADRARTPVGRLIEITAALPGGRERLETWCARVTELIAASGMETAVAELAPADPGLTNALEGLKDALASLGRASARLRSRTTLSGFMYVLRKELSARRYSQDARSMAGVRIITGLELLSELFDTLFALGLSDSSSPAGFAPDIFFQGRDVGLPGRDAHDAREARRFLAALMCAGRVHLVHPETGKRGPVPESPYIRALRPFVDAGIVTRTGRWCRPSDPAQAVSAAGAMRGLAMRAALSGGPDRDALLRALGALPADTPGIARAKASLGRSAAPAPLAPPDRREFSVTELEEYLLCHYRYYQDRVAGSAPVEDPEDDIAPHRAGSAMHGILAEFYEKAKGPVTSDNAESELARLRAIAAERFRALPETAANWELARRFDEFLAPRFIITETKLAGSGYAPCLFEQTVRLEVTDEEHGSYAITGKVDRVELAADGGFVVVDYKTGKYPGPAEKLTELFQLPLYAHMLKESGAPLPGGRPGRPVGFVYYNLRDGSMRDVVLYEADAGVVGADPAKRGRKVAADTLDKRIEDAFNKAKEAVRDLLSGRFEPTCDKKQVCERCVYIDVCESPAGERDAEDNGGEVED